MQSIEQSRRATPPDAICQPVLVFVVYETAFADVDGTLQFRADAYGHDAEIWQYLNPARQAAAERGAPARRGG